MQENYQVDFPDSAGHSYVYIFCYPSELRNKIRDVIIMKAELNIFYPRATIRKYDKDKKKALDVIAKVNAAEMKVLLKYR